MWLSIRVLFIPIPGAGTPGANPGITWGLVGVFPHLFQSQKSVVSQNEKSEWNKRNRNEIIIMITSDDRKKSDQIHKRNQLFPKFKKLSLFYVNLNSVPRIIRPLRCCFARAAEKWSPNSANP